MTIPRALNTGLARSVFKWTARLNIAVYRATGGRIGGKLRLGSRCFGDAPPVGILTTIGRRSGRPRSTPLLYLRDDNRVILVASQGGRAENPMWYLNLTANPAVTFQIRGELLSLRARDADVAERHRYWPLLDEMYPEFATYRSWTEREIPVVVCEP